MIEVKQLGVFGCVFGHLLSMQSLHVCTCTGVRVWTISPPGPRGHVRAALVAVYVCVRCRVVPWNIPFSYRERRGVRCHQ